MKIKVIAFIMLITCSGNLHAQSGPGDNYQGRLYRLCKVWGYVKYYHSAVSHCKVNWDSILVATIPLVKAATDSDQFNAALLQMLDAAGPMARALTPAPVLDTLTAINVDFSWINDSYFSDSVITILDTIHNNFRPDSTSCQVVLNNYSVPGNNSWLLFPGDSASPIISSYPAEPTRLLTLFRYWNIIKYFNPNNKILNIPWDSTLLNNVLLVANASNQAEYNLALLRVITNINDTHARPSFLQTFPFSGNYLPGLVFTYADTCYVVTKTQYNFIHVGDIIDSFAGLSMNQWEDSFLNYIPASNIAAFRSDICQPILSGVSGSQASIVYRDSLENEHNDTVIRNLYDPDWFTFYISGIDTTTQWKIVGCNVGYVNIGNLQQTNVIAMYDSLGQLPAIIFDMREYPDLNFPSLDSLMYSNASPVANFLQPDITYPGNFYYTLDSAGPYVTTSDSTYTWVTNTTPYNGKVILLINEQTLSAGEFDCMQLSQNRNVIKIGSQTAGADGNVTDFQLNPEFTILFSSLGVYYPNGIQTQRIGIVPDIVVKPTATGIRHGVDEVLDSAIAIACTTSGITKLENNSFELYPNPTDNFITIESSTNSEVLQIRISNLLGQQVKEAIMSGNIETIDVSGFPSGLYFVSIISQDGPMQITKFIKL